MSEELGRCSPRALHHARVLTRGNRILCLYVSSLNPSDKLKDLGKIVMQLYAPGWFRVKFLPSVSDGAQNFWYILSCSKNLKVEHQEIVVRCLNKNAFFAHSDNLLIAMLADESQSVRLRALSLISDVPGSHKERNFVLPQVNPNAKDYTKIISLKYEQATPPLLRERVNLTEIELTPFGLMIFLAPAKPRTNGCCSYPSCRVENGLPK